MNPFRFRNVVLITLDCVRPDFLGCYGCQGAQTPALDRLAARGAVFELAFSQAPNTWVSHAGMLSGLYPPLHGLRSPYAQIHPDVSTLASLLAEKGFRTAGFPGNDLVGSRMGFNRGFDLYFENYQGVGECPDSEQTGVNANVRNEWSHVLEASENWLSTQDGPVFLWFHYLDTHHLPNCDLPEYFRFSRDPAWQFYEGKISYADQRCVGAIVEMLTRHGFYEETLFIVTSDHGEQLRQGAPPRHNGALTEEVLRVPLILFCEGIPWSGVRISSLVRTTDLVPTLLQALDGAEEGGKGAWRGFSGIPLPLPGLLSREVDMRSGEQGMDTAYAENDPQGLRCIRSQEWKLVRSPSGECLYHLPSDPLEQRDVLVRYPKSAEYLRASLENIRANARSGAQLSEREEEETRRILRFLGYMD